MNDMIQEFAAPGEGVVTNHQLVEESNEISPRPKRWRWLIGCAVLVAMIAAGLSQIPEAHDKQVYTQQFTQAKKAIAQQKEKDTALKLRLKEETKQVPPPSPPVPTTPPAEAFPPAPPLTEMQQALPDNAQEQLLRLQEKTQAQQKEIDSLHTEIKAIHQHVAQQQLLWRTYHSLQHHIAEGKPFTDILRPLTQERDSFPQEIASAIARLQPYAEYGVVDKAALEALFAQNMAEYYRTHPLYSTGNAEETSGITAWLGGLVEVRKIGTQHSGDDDASRLARAEMALQQHDIAAALQEVRALSVKAVPFFKGWRKKAYRYQEATRAMQTFSQALEKE